MSRGYGLRDDQWAKIEDMLLGREGSVGRRAKDNRLFIEGVLYRYRSGIPWRDLPERLIDSTIVRAHQHSSGAKEKGESGAESETIGRSVGGLSTKIHTVVDALGNPMLFFDSWFGFGGCR